ncbi:NAD(P)H-binding protein [Nocardioides sp. STR2]|uniref:NAD(P)H-binding protein n=1 Tax=Nocardioides pini TaxID=2975053 RepID=A0ABT4C6U7_9ACTN|nr:NAD(P)H-binding protein [Nocardioides pini]MCY4724683.1 NAD(P)H-binding protein [Nocardioides pini]
MTILVTGATGTIGSRLLDLLSDEGVRPRALVRDPDRAAGVVRDRADLVQGDLAEPASVRAALAGVDRVFLVSANGPDQVHHEQAVIDAASAVGLDRLVKVSASGAHPEASNAFWRAHSEVEAYLAATGVPSVLLRPTFLMSNLLAASTPIRERGLLLAPAGHARIAMIDPGDVALIAARALQDSDFEPGVLELTGPAAVTHHEVAAALTAATGRHVSYVDVTPQDAVAGLVSAGVPEAGAREVVRVYDSLRRGDQSVPTHSVASVTGRAATPLAEFVAAHASAFTERVAG